MIAGVDRRLGTLEPGKLGHVIAMTAPFNDEKAKVKYVLIDGLKFEIKPEDRSRLKSRAGRADGLASAGEPGERRRPGGRGCELLTTMKRPSRPSEKTLRTGRSKDKSASRQEDPPTTKIPAPPRPNPRMSCRKKSPARSDGE